LKPHTKKYWEASVNRTSLLLLLALLSIAGVSQAETPAESRAARLQQHVLGVDAHNDTVQRLMLSGVDLGVRTSNGAVDLPRLREGGMHVPFFALWVPMYYKGSEAVRRTLDLRDKMQEVFDRYPDQIELATSATDIEHLVKRGKIAAVLTIEGGHQIAEDLAVLRMYRRIGILSMTLTHFRSNSWADSATAPAEHNGLTDFGKSVVREMNRIGMIVDVSHVSDKTFYDTLEVSTKPVIASHSSCRALADFPRNMSDDMLRALAKNGGVVGVNFYSAYLNPKDSELGRQLIAAHNKREPDLTGAALDDYALQDHRESGEANPVIGSATIEDAVSCIDHIAKTAGIDHVGIGGDFDGIPIVPKGLEDVSKMPAVTAALLQRGFSESDIRKIMGENFLRVIRQVVGR
jgi:membrane dipeptidase